MKRFIFIIGMIFNLSYAQGYIIVFSDDFNRLDTIQHWDRNLANINCIVGSSGPLTLSTIQNRNAVANSGNLELWVKNDPGMYRCIEYNPDGDPQPDGYPNKRFFQLTGAGVMSKDRYQFGIFQWFAKSHPTRGFWPAFWMYSIYAASPGGELDEIDIFEGNTGDKPNSIHYDTHCDIEMSDGGCNPVGWDNMHVNLSSNYNLYELQWLDNTSKQYLKFYFGENVGGLYGHFKYKTIKMKKHYDYAMNILMNTNSPSTFLGPTNAFRKNNLPVTGLPSSFNIDKVRVYQYLD